MEIDITYIIKIVVYLVFAVLGGVAIPLIKRKLTTAQEESLKYWVEVAVMAAEGLFKRSGAGDLKFKYVVNFLESKGFTLDTDEVQALVESSVYDLINQFKTTEDENGLTNLVKGEIPNGNAQ